MIQTDVGNDTKLRLANVGGIQTPSQADLKNDLFGTLLLKVKEPCRRNNFKKARWSGAIQQRLRIELLHCLASGL